MDSWGAMVFFNKNRVWPPQVSKDFIIRLHFQLQPNHTLHMCWLYIVNRFMMCPIKKCKNPSNLSIDANYYLKYIDLVLVMSVEPGKGGQSFIVDSVKKIEQLYNLRENQNYNYVIEVDGGINDETIKLCNKADIVVVGS